MSTPRRRRRTPPPNPASLDFPPARMRRLGYRAVDMVVRHLTDLRRSRLGKIGTRARMRALLEEPPPLRANPPLAVLRRVGRQIMPYTLSPHHPRFFAFIPSGAAYPGVLADFLASGFNVFAGTWMEASGPAQVELSVVDWFRRWLGMPAAAGGLMLSGGSAANLHALVAARETLLSRLPRRQQQRAVIYASDQTHSSIARAARVLDFPAERLRRIDTDSAYRMRLDSLKAAIDRDRRRGLIPFCVVANAGSTNTGSVDPLPALARLCRRERLWLHADAAYGGFAVLTRRGHALLRGVGRADSVTLDPHKWLYAPFEAGCVLVRDRRLLRRAFAGHAEYLQDIRARQEEINFYEYGTQLTRSFRALKVWMIVQTYGTRRLAAAIDRALDQARRAEAWLAGRPAFEILSPAALGIVCFRHLGNGPRPGREPAPPPRRGLSGETPLRRLNEEIVRRVRERGRSFFTSTELRGRYALRLCILGHRTQWGDVRETLEEIDSTAARIVREVRLRPIR